VSYLNRHGADGTRDAMRATNPAAAAPVPPHDHPDLHSRIANIESMFAFLDEPEGGDHPEPGDNEPDAPVANEHEEMTQP